MPSNSPKIEVLIEATQSGFDQVIAKLQQLQNTMRSVQSTTPVATFQQFTDVLTQLTAKINENITALNNQQEATHRGTLGMLTMQWNLRSLIGDIEKMIAIQLRWYGARMLLFAMFSIPKEAAITVIEYGVEIDKLRAELLRWEATSGKVSSDAVAHTDAMVLAIRKAVTEYPLKIKELGEAAQAFIGAGVAYPTVTEMIPDIARLKTAFKEINFDQFAVAVTGAFNVFRSQLAEGGSDAERFREIIEKILRAQAVGIIRPEQFTKVLQYMTQMSNVAGLSLDQLLAMATAITNTGVAAASASRLAAGFMQSLTSAKGMNALRDIGIEIDKDKTLGSQLDNIMVQLKKHLGEGEVPAGWMEWLGTLTREDRLKALLAFVGQYTTFVKLTGEIARSGGGLAAAADIMKMPIANQWVVFNNILKEVGVALSIIDDKGHMPGLQSMVGMLVDIARGLLFAADSSGLFSDRIDKLGGAGKVAYNIMKTFVELWATWKVILTPVGIALGTILSLLSSLAAFLLEHRTILEYIIDVLLVRLVQILTLSLWGTIANSAGSLLFVLRGIGLALTSVVTGTASMGAALTLFSTGTLPLVLARLNLVALAIGAIIIGIAALVNASNAPDKEVAQYRTLASTKGYKDLEKDVASMEKKLAEIPAAPTESIYAGEGAVAQYAPAGAVDEGVLKRKIAIAKELIATKKEEEVQNKKTADSEYPDEAGDKSAQKLINTAKRNYRILLDESRKYYDDEQKSLEEQHKRGEIDDERYYEMRQVLQLEAFNDEATITGEYKDKITTLYKQLTSEIASDKKLKDGQRAGNLKAAHEAEENDIREASTKLRDLYQKGEQLLDKDLTEAILRRKQLRLDELNFLDRLQKQQLDQQQKAAEQQLKVSETVTKYLYDWRLISAKQSFDDLAKIESEGYLNKDAALAKELANEKTLLDQRLNVVGLSEKEKQKLLEDYLLQTQKIGDQRVNLEAETNQRILALTIEYQNSVSYLYETEGIAGVWKAQMKDIRQNYADEGKNLLELTSSIAKGMTSAFSDFFFDVISLKAKSFTEYMQSLLNSVTRAWSDYLGKKVTSSVFGGLDNLFGVEGGHEGAIIGSSASSYHLVPSGTFAGAPRRHRGGLLGNEVPFIGKVGEGVFTEDQMSNMASIPDIVAAIGGLNIGGGKGTTPATGGAQGQQMHVTIHAIDSKSFEEYVKRNPKAIVQAVSTALQGNENLRYAIKGVMR